MPARTKALITPEVLRWARESRGLDVEGAANKLKQKPEKLAAWEAGVASPTVPQLRKIAEVYKRPIAVFYLPRKPQGFDALRDFRRLPSDYPRELSSELLYLVRRAQERQEWARELRAELETSELDFVGSATMADNVTALAARSRAILGVDVTQQLRWRTMDEALRAWIDALEGTGVLVFQSSKFDQIETIEMRGFALPDRIAPVVVVNSKDAKSARVFSLLHEFVHLLLDAGGISNLEYAPRSRTPEQKIEVFCNAVAAEALVPEAHLAGRVRRARLGTEIDSEIASLSRAYSVSREVIARRLCDAGLIGKPVYRSKREQYLKEFLERGPAKQGELKIPYSRFVLRDYGRAFARLVLGAYRARHVTAAETSHLLGAKSRHVRAVESEVYPLRLGRSAAR